ncbi:MAG: FeoB-associated Cys-rich membrane protein [Clostridia bacterium]|nr:FeoB-associated Cys-rich membrane protein [Clostridia bacterium]
MFNWLINNIGSILVLLAVAGIVALITAFIIRSKKKGKNSCGCGGGCVGCSGCGSCPHALPRKK